MRAFLQGTQEFQGFSGLLDNDKPSESICIFQKDVEERGDEYVLPDHITLCWVTVRLKIILVF